jgi:hypothetical protein
LTFLLDRCDSNSEGDIYLGFQFLELMEITVDGKVVRSLPFPQNGFSLALSESEVSENFLFSRKLNNGSSNIELSISLLYLPSSITYGDSTRILDAGSIKWTFRFSGWKFMNISNLLSLTVKIRTGGQQLLRVSMNSPPPIPGSMTFELHSSASVATINFANFAFVDEQRQKTEIDWHNPEEFKIQLPYFNDSLFYDPDLSMFFSTFGECHSPTQANLLFIALVVLVPLVSILTLIAMLLVYFWAKLQRRRRHRDLKRKLSTFDKS